MPFVDGDDGDHQRSPISGQDVALADTTAKLLLLGLLFGTLVAVVRMRCRRKLPAALATLIVVDLLALLCWVLAGLLSPGEQLLPSPAGISLLVWAAIAHSLAATAACIYWRRLLWRHFRHTWLDEQEEAIVYMDHGDDL